MYRKPRSLKCHSISTETHILTAAIYFMYKWEMHPLRDLASCYPTQGLLHFLVRRPGLVEVSSVPSARLRPPPAGRGVILGEGPSPLWLCLPSQRPHVCRRTCRVMFSHLCLSSCLSGPPGTLAGSGSCCRKRGRGTQKEEEIQPPQALCRVPMMSS